MQQLVSSSDTLPPAADGALEKCDRDCQEAAVFSYRWEWGETGVCCAVHAQLLQQTAGTLNRSIALHPIHRNVAAEPLLRDERIQLVARGLVLEAELEEAKSRGLETYRRNGDLQVQLNTAIVKERELKAQLTDASITLDQTRQKLAEVDARNGELLVELERLRALETFVAERDDRERNERGLDGDTVIDG